ncbi:hypothetical protein AAMO2058_001053700 [Amorphochlora amoebiformis]
MENEGNSEPRIGNSTPLENLETGQGVDMEKNSTPYLVEDKKSDVLDNETKAALEVDDQSNYFETTRDELMEKHGYLREPIFPTIEDAVISFDQDCVETQERIRKLKESKDQLAPPPDPKRKEGCDWGFTYIVSVRIRFGIIYLLSLCLTFASMVAFVLTILFSVVLHDATSDEGWGLRVAFMLPLGPIILIVGSLICDELLEMFLDAISYFPLHNYRLRLAAVVYYVWNKMVGCLNRSMRTELGSQKIYYLHLSHLRTVEIIMPGIIELAGAQAFLISLCLGQGLFVAFSSYLTSSVVVACGFALLSPILTLLCVNHPVIRKLYRSFTRDAPAIQEHMLHTKPPLNEGKRPRLRVLNLCRYLQYTGCYESSDDSNRCCSWICGSYNAVFSWYHSKCPWGLRLGIDIAMYIMFASLSTVRGLPTGVRWFFVVLFCCMIGFKFSERWPYIFGYFYSCILTFFCFASFLYFCAAVAQPSLDSNLTIKPPSFSGASSIVAQPLDITAVGYPICTNTWNGLTALDLALMADNTYANSKEKMQQNLALTFNNTDFQNFTLSFREDQRTINFYHVNFPEKGVDVVAVRGTSTDEEAFADTYLYSTISIFQALNVWIPFLDVLPAAYIRDIVGFLALSNIAGSQPYRWADDYVKNLIDEGKSPIVTGHSLGGAIGGIIGVRNSRPGLYFSPPGMFYSSERFGITVEKIMRYNSVIVPQKDAVPKVDSQWGNVQHIQCTHSTVACHSISNTACDIQSKCGDQRQRDWTEYCPEQENDEGVDSLQVFGFTLVSVIGILLLYLLFKIKHLLCPSIFKPTESIKWPISEPNRKDSKVHPSDVSQDGKDD